MRASEFITEDYEIRHKPTKTGGAEVEAYKDKSMVGYVMFQPTDENKHKATMVWVSKYLRRQGIGSAMYRYAREKLGFDLVPSNHQTELGKAFWNKIHEDTDNKLAWRIRFRRFKGMPSYMPEREGKVYLMPTDHSALRTFGNLTGKDDEKITQMPTEAYLVSGDAMVGDMSIINAISRETKTTNNQDRIEQLKKLYLNYRVPYSQYKPGMFKYPEILADPSQLTKLDKSVVYDRNTGEIVIKDKNDTNKPRSRTTNP